MPLLACFPMCTTFFALAILAVVMVIAGAGGAGKTADAEAVPEAPQKVNLPEWWVVALILGVTAVVMGLLAWSTWDY